VRANLLTLRRTRLMLSVSGALVALAGVARWVSVWLESGGTEASPSLAILWATPILLAFVVASLVGIPEWRVRRAERAKALGAAATSNAPPVRGELVNMWLASAERVRKSFAGPSKSPEPPKKK